MTTVVIMKFCQGGGRRRRRRPAGRYEMGARQQSIAHLAGQLFRVDDGRRQRRRRRRKTLPFRHSVAKVIHLSRLQIYIEKKEMLS